MNVTKFNNNFQNNFLRKINQEQKQSFFQMILILTSCIIMNIHKQMNFQSMQDYQLWQVVRYNSCDITTNYAIRDTKDIFSKFFFLNEFLDSLFSNSYLPYTFQTVDMKVMRAFSRKTIWVAVAAQDCLIVKAVKTSINVSKVSYKSCHLL